MSYTGCEICQSVRFSHECQDASRNVCIVFRTAVVCIVLRTIQTRYIVVKSSLTGDNVTAPHERITAVHGPMPPSRGAGPEARRYRFVLALLANRLGCYRPKDDNNHLSSCQCILTGCECQDLVTTRYKSRTDAIANAKALLGVPYLWGGNSTVGMDCSAYVSRAWGVPRQTTDTLTSSLTQLAKKICSRAMR